MPVVFILVAALLYGAYKLYTVTAGAWGIWAGSAAVVAAAALAAGMVVALVHRHRALHGRLTHGQRLLETSGDWGHLVLNAEGRRGQLRFNDRELDFLFGDIAKVQRSQDETGPAVVLALRNAPQRELRIPMTSPRQARRWATILTLAERRTL